MPASISAADQGASGTTAVGDVAENCAIGTYGTQQVG